MPTKKWQSPGMKVKKTTRAMWILAGKPCLDCGRESMGAQLDRTYANVDFYPCDLYCNTCWGRKLLANAVPDRV